MSLLLALSLLQPLPQVDRIAGRPFATRSEALSLHGMAATSHPLATDAALDVLKAGGTAVDAAIAANAVLCFGEPTGCESEAICSAIVYEAETGEVHGYNGGSRSPKGLTLEQLREEHGLERLPHFGPLPVSVPGCVDGWTALHGRFGALPLEAVLAPAIGHAEEGFSSQTIAHYWRGNSAA